MKGVNKMNEQHPIQGLMYTAMQSLKEMIDVNTIVGDAVQTPDGTVVIPISKVGLGFAVGGSDYGMKGNKGDSVASPMFGGGSGGGVSITPVAFMVVGNGQIRMIPVNPENTIYDRILDMIPTAIDKISDGINKVRGKKNSDGTSYAETSINDFDSIDDIDDLAF